MRGSPLGLPRIENPSDDDINKWHGKYVSEVQRIFEKYKTRVPEYKNKKLLVE